MEGKAFSWKKVLRRALLGVVLLFLGCLGGLYYAMGMPGKSWSGPLPELTSDQAALAETLRRDVEALAGRIGERNFMTPDAYREAADILERRFGDAGLKVSRETYEAREATFTNLVAEIPGSEEGILVVGAHYDSVSGCPGANDNGSGVAALLALAGRLSGTKPRRTIRFVAFANEEPPWFLTPDMGSRVHSAGCKKRGEKIVGMISLETIGYYSDEEGSQNYPSPLNLFYPSTGNFIAFVGNLSSRNLVRRSIGAFRERAKFPSEGAAMPGWLEGVYWSDHWSFWEEGYPALMVTDTAPFRYPHYHMKEDTPGRLVYDRFARVVEGLDGVIRELAGIDPAAGD